MERVNDNRERISLSIVIVHELLFCIEKRNCSFTLPFEFPVLQINVIRPKVIFLSPNSAANSYFIYIIFSCWIVVVLDNPDSEYQNFVMLATQTIY